MMPGLPGEKTTFLMILIMKKRFSPQKTDFASFCVADGFKTNFSS